MIKLLLVGWLAFDAAFLLVLGVIGYRQARRARAVPNDPKFAAWVKRMATDPDEYSPGTKYTRLAREHCAFRGEVVPVVKFSEEPPAATFSELSMRYRSRFR